MAVLTSSLLSRRRLFRTLACGCAAVPAGFLTQPIAAQSAAKSTYSPDQALAMLTEPTPVEQKVLGAVAYQPNRATLHTDTSLLSPGGMVVRSRV